MPINTPAQTATGSLLYTDYNQVLNALEFATLDISTSGINMNNTVLASGGAATFYGLVTASGGVNSQVYSFNQLIDKGSISGAQTINFASGLVQGCTVVSGITITWSPPTIGSQWRGTVYFLQDSTGSRIPTFSKTEFVNGGSQLTLSGGRMDIVTVMPSYRAGSYVASISTVY